MQLGADVKKVPHAIEDVEHLLGLTCVLTQLSRAGIGGFGLGCRIALEGRQGKMGKMGSGLAIMYYVPPSGYPQPA